MLNEIAETLHSSAIARGWYDTERGIPELIALCHSELSEALEAYRDWADPKDVVMTWPVDKPFGTNLKPEGFSVELADCIIRILDMCAYLGIDIDEALRLKMEYNETRPYRHGNKRA